jgi:hypothetical protein
MWGEGVAAMTWERRANDDARVSNMIEIGYYKRGESSVRSLERVVDVDGRG